MKTKLLILPFLALCFLPGLVRAGLELESYRAASERAWEKSITELEALDRAERHPADSILFLGSSSIRLWQDIDGDLAPYHPIRRGFGGSRWPDLAVYADRLIQPHAFRAVVFFVANDITGGKDDKSPEQVAELAAYLWQKVRQHNPDAHIFFIATTPTAARWPVWPRIREANSAIRTLCLGKPNTHFIGTESIFLDSKLQPRTELFGPDKLHLNRQGYTLWAAAIKSQLDTALNRLD